MGEKRIVYHRHKNHTATAQFAEKDPDVQHAFRPIEDEPVEEKDPAPILPGPDIDE